MVERALRHRAPLLWVLVPYAGGLVAARCFPNESAPGLWLALGAALALVAIFRRSPGRFALGALLAGAFLTGFGRCLEVRRRSPALEGLPARAITGEIRIERLFPRAKAGRVSGIARIEKADTPPEWLGQRFAFSLRAPRGDAPRAGETFRVYAVASILPDAAPPDTFEGYLISAGINFSARRGRFLERTAPAGRLDRWQQAALDCCEAWLRRGLEGHPELVGVYHGLLLGEISALDPEQKTLFGETGTMHLFSVSGLHIGVVALVLHTALAWLPLRPRVALLVPLLGGYVWLTGGSPAAVRAFWMVATLEIGRACEQRPNPLSALCTAALISLAWDPLQVFSASFQFSYAIVASLILLGAPLQAQLEKRGTPFDRRPQALRRPWHRAGAWLAHHLRSALCLGVAASLVGELCTLQYFHLLTPGGLAANLILIPLSSLAIVAGMLALALSLLGLGWVAAFFNHAAGVVVWLTLRLLEPWHGWSATYCRAAFHSPAVGFAVFAGLLALLAAGYARQWRPNRWAWFAPWVAVALALVFGVKFN
ncbi:ComEC/Rec2 family competence protein [Nibricoccus sp. IMCC34717]|uniref:ComEC/Rec2 family competence protein n=1 Tax=Nibricoccus sp. IMCC34717 TaxID=3034021 RepID=UPI00384C62DB